MNCKPIFSFSIDMKLSDKGVVVGKYDAVNPSLTAITQSNKVSPKNVNRDIVSHNFRSDYHPQPQHPIQYVQFTKGMV
jgi:hypothetical protein